MTKLSLFEQVLDYGSRADPYPLYAKLRKTPVSRQDDGSFVVSTYQEIVDLLHDPRVSSDIRNLPRWSDMVSQDALPPSFLALDPPEHDRLRRLTMRYFGPPHTPDRVDGLRPRLHRIVSGLVDEFAGKSQIDIVDDFAYPFPVTVICELLGVPREDEPRFHVWADALVETLDPAGDPAEQVRKRSEARAEAARYLADLVEERRRAPADDLLSALANNALASDGRPADRMSDEELVSTALTLLIAGHETTVNLIANGTLTLLRHPEVLQRLHADPTLIIRATEELLRFEPPVHFLPWRSSLDDIELAGTTVPKGSQLTLVLAAGSRDPAHVRDPDRFDPDRTELEHLGFGGGVHYCFGAPLARIEAQIALLELARRLDKPRLVADPPPYRASPILRGPRHLLIECDDIAP